MGNKISLEVLSILVPSLISVIGFIFTYTNMKRSFENESINQKRNIQLNKVMDLPYDILDLLDDMLDLLREKNQKNIKRENKKIIEKMRSIQSLIYAYGSLNSIKIISNFQKDIYELEKDDSKVDENSLIPQYILLVSQLKYDITGEVITPKYWFEMKIKDNINYKETYRQSVNDLVEKLNLNEKFKE